MRVFASHAVEPNISTGRHHGVIKQRLPVPVAAVSSMPSEGISVQRKSNCACGGGCPSCQQNTHPETIQTKLQVSTPGDQYEQEADRVAEQVMRMPDVGGHAPVQLNGHSSGLRAQRKSPGCADGQLSGPHQDEENIQPKSLGGQASFLTTKTQSQVEALRASGGQPLSANDLEFFEPRFNQDFSHVRVHTDSQASESAQAVNALAYTVGDDIVFGQGNYRPATASGRELLAHELTHTIQQNGRKPKTPPAGRSSSTNRSSSTGSPSQVATKSDSQGFGFRQIQSQPLQVARQDAGAPDAGVPEDIHDAGETLPGGVPEPVSPVTEETTTATPVEQTVPPVPILTQQPMRGLGWRDCPSKRGRGNSSVRLSGFNGTNAGTHISDIQVEVHTSSFTIVTLTWQNLSLSPGATPPTTLNASPGAGRCDTDCSNNCNSQASGSHCTSLSPPTFQVQGYGCALGSYPTATFVTWFNYAREIAFHYFNIPSYPASHGCVRMDHATRGAEWIFDNTLPGITNVTVNWNASEGPGTHCWRGGAIRERPASAPTGPTGACAPATPGRRRRRR